MSISNVFTCISDIALKPEETHMMNILSTFNKLSKNSIGIITFIFVFRTLINSFTQIISLLMYKVHMCEISHRLIYLSQTIEIIIIILGPAYVQWCSPAPFPLSPTLNVNDQDLINTPKPKQR